MPKFGLSRWGRGTQQHRDAGLTVGELLLILVVGAIAIGGAWFTMRQLATTNGQSPVPSQGAQPSPQPVNPPVAKP